MTTPATIGGKVFLIFYGLIGCAASILFFNLFLERVITMITFVLKFCHERRHRHEAVLPQNERPPDAFSRRGRNLDSMAGWKPSVYCVMPILGAVAILVSCCATAMYSSVEGWGYLDAVSLYFNVLSIVLKQVLYCLMHGLELLCRRCPTARGAQNPRRNAVYHGSRDPSIEIDVVNESEADGRRMSGEMISMRDFLPANKVNLAIMQKQLSEMANGHPRQSGSGSRHNGFSGGVGALGIMNNRLAETSADR